MMAGIMSRLSGPQGLTGQVGEEAPVRVQVGAKPSLAVRVGGGQALNARPGRGVGVTARLGKRKFRGSTSELTVWNENILCLLPAPSGVSACAVQRHNAMIILPAQACSSSISVAVV